MTYAEAGHGMGVDPNRLRYGTTTGRILIRWEGAGRPPIWTVPAPEMSVEEARLELARRFLHVLGPGTAEAFGDWAGIKPPRASRTIDRSPASSSRSPLRSAIAGSSRTTRPAFRAAPGIEPRAIRLLPSGDT